MTQYGYETKLREMSDHVASLNNEKEEREKEKNQKNTVRYTSPSIKYYDRLYFHLIHIFRFSYLVVSLSSNDLSSREITKLSIRHTKRCSIHFHFYPAQFISLLGRITLILLYFLWFVSSLQFFSVLQ